MKASLVSRLKKKNGKLKAKSKSKIKAADVTADDDAPPWEETPAERKKRKKLAKQLKTEAAELGVRGIGSPEDEDEDDFFQEENAKFKKTMDKIAKRVSDPRQPYNSPATQELVTREALASVLRLLGGYNETSKSSNAERAAYAYVALTNQTRELMSDLRAMSSTDALAERTINEAVQPLFLGLINYMIQEVSTIKSKLNGSNNVESLRRTVNEQLTRMMQEVGEFGQESLFAAMEKTRDSLRN